jgi:hypothetical protein
VPDVLHSAKHLALGKVLVSGSGKHASVMLNIRDAAAKNASVVYSIKDETVIKCVCDDELKKKNRT